MVVKRDLFYVSILRATGQGTEFRMLSLCLKRQCSFLDCGQGEKGDNGLSNGFPVLHYPGELSLPSNHQPSCWRHKVLRSSRPGREVGSLRTRTRKRKSSP